MVGPQWSDDPDTPALQSNLHKVARDVVLNAFAGETITAEHIKAWHAGMYEGIPVPCDAYLGHFRGDSGHSELLDAENQVNRVRGVRSYLVYGEVEELLKRMHDDIALLAADDAASVERDMEVIRIAAYAHGEWIRIHPFVNGNGRTARLLVLWVLARFGVPPLLPIRPRPARPYEATSNASMAGEHEPFELHLRDLYAAQSRQADFADDEDDAGSGSDEEDSAD